MCVGRRALFVDNANREAILGSGLPCLENPSDHVPVGAVLQVWFKSMQMSLENRD